jgi:hypothetical protein
MKSRVIKKEDNSELKKTQSSVETFSRRMLLGIGIAFFFGLIRPRGVIAETIWDRYRKAQSQLKRIMEQRRREKYNRKVPNNRNTVRAPRSNYFRSPTLKSRTQMNRIRGMNPSCHEYR